MKKFKILSVVFLAVILVSFKGDSLPDDFTKLLARAHITYIAPEGMEAAPVIKNTQMGYDYAVKFPDKDFEIRYSIRPLDSLLMRYKNPKQNETAISPNKFYSPAFTATMMNVSQGHMSAPKPFPADAVKKEFNADWGATCASQTTGTFAGVYKFCLGITIHKDDMGDAYIFYLTNDPANFQTLLPKVFHTLKFD